MNDLRKKVANNYLKRHLNDKLFLTIIFSETRSVQWCSKEQYIQMY
jgi:hypothetical protein